MSIRNRLLSILAEFTRRSPGGIHDDELLSDLLDAGPNPSLDDAIPDREARSLRPCELRLFLLAMTVEDETGLDLTMHAGFDRLLCGTVGDLIAAAESL